MMGGDTGDEVETSLRTAIKLNPRFAPAYDRLAVLYGRRHEKLDEAHMLELQAIQLEPAQRELSAEYGEHSDGAGALRRCLQVLQAAAAIARNPLEADVVQRVLRQVQQQEVQMEEAKHRPPEAQIQTTVMTEAQGSSQANNALANGTESKPKHPTETPHGQIHDGARRDSRRALQLPGDPLAARGKRDEETSRSTATTTTRWITAPRTSRRRATFIPATIWRG